MKNPILSESERERGVFENCNIAMAKSELSSMFSEGENYEDFY